MIRSEKIKRILEAEKCKAAKRVAFAKKLASQNKISSPTYQNSQNIETWLLRPTLSRATDQTTRQLSTKWPQLRRLVCLERLKIQQFAMAHCDAIISTLSAR